MLKIKILIQKIQKSGNVKNEDFNKIRQFLKTLDAYKPNNDISNLLLDFIDFCIKNDKLKTKFAIETIDYIFKKLNFYKAEEDLAKLLDNTYYLRLKFLSDGKKQKEFIENSIEFLKSNYPLFNKYLTLKKEFFDLKENKKNIKNKKVNSFNIKFLNSLKKFENYYNNELTIKDLSEIKNKWLYLDESKLKKFSDEFISYTLDDFPYYYSVQRILKKNIDKKIAEQKIFDIFLEKFFWYFRRFETSEMRENSILKLIEPQKDRNLISYYEIKGFQTVLAPIIIRYFYELSNEERNNYKNFKYNLKNFLNKNAIEFLIYFLKYLNKYGSQREKFVEHIKKYQVIDNKEIFINIINNLDFSNLIKLLEYIKDNYTKENINN